MYTIQRTYYDCVRLKDDFTRLTLNYTKIINISIAKINTKPTFLNIFINDMLIKPPDDKISWIQFDKQIKL